VDHDKEVSSVQAGGSLTRPDKPPRSALQTCLKPCQVLTKQGTCLPSQVE
jgi:hypothetical protein